MGKIPACRKQERDGLGTILGWEVELWGVMGLIRRPPGLLKPQEL